MNIFKRYLEKRKQQKERRKQEYFLNTRIPLNDLFWCYMYHINNIEYIEGVIPIDPTRRVTFEYSGVKILRKLEEGFIDPTTGTKYARQDYYNKVGDIVVSKTKTIIFTKEILERQYITIKELIAFNEELNNE